MQDLPYPNQTAGDLVLDFAPGCPVLLHPTGAPGDPFPAAAWEILNAAEQDRAGRFHHPLDRDRWVRGRAWVKQVLAQRLGVPAPSLLLKNEPDGRLTLPPEAGLDFNLSHTGSWIALGIVPSGRIGIDLETVQPDFPALEIAAEFFLPEERDWVAGGTIRRFFHLWTAKEALMKATGRGMSLPPNHIRVLVSGEKPVQVVNLEDGRASTVHTGEGPDGTIAAVVLLENGSLEDRPGPEAH